MKPWAWVAVGAGAVGLFLATQGGGDEEDADTAADPEEGDVATETDDSSDALSSPPVAAVGPYLDIINVVAADESVSPLLIVAIGWRESRWGTSGALDVKDATGTGDFAVRRWFKSDGKLSQGAKPHRAAVSAVSGRWKNPNNVPGTVNGQPNLAYPDDGRGWGRGLMQLDLDESLAAGQWWDPETNIRAGVKIWKQKRAVIARSEIGSSLTDTELDQAATAAYNAGEGTVISTLKARYANEGIACVDTFTSGKNYSADVFSNIAKWS